ALEHFDPRCIPDRHDPSGEPGGRWLAGPSGSEIVEANVSILQVRDLKTHFFTQDGVVRAVDGVSFEVGLGETVAVVGESGCGKSVTALSILRLIPKETGRIVGGEILFNGR